MRLAVIGLSLSSSWGNGHATTFRSLLRGMHGRGHEVLFLEQDVPWYAPHRDLTEPDFARLALYADPEDLRARFAGEVADADAVIVGSYVQRGPEVLDWVRDTARGTVAFYDIDTPITLSRMGRADHYIRPDQVPGLDLYLSFTGGPTLGRIERDLGAPRARALYCSVDAARYRPEAREGRRRWQLGYLGTYSEDRQPVLDALLLEPARRRGGAFVVAGPQYPGGIDWPRGVERIDHLPPARHPGFYNDQDFTLNVTRADMVAAGWSPSVRLFEAGACGTPIVSDAWEGLDALLPEGEAIVIARGPGDVEAALDLPATRRAAMGRAAREIVRARHSSDARAAELEAFLEEAA
ncbi:spore maturation protein CgeB [Hasllibacter halocynthiae]|uniref:Spore maturation protein CgeB n=1 Tax=Hasllibacter halocynthiae TaxID=595589 RepID=A0A2T0X961_9RHOB|nr:glycosyltransferase [Hasllibacter halocynthiae]PRY95463.1 spore maturation protein CgeB [Hasllibacter halocynthiae]